MSSGRLTPPAGPPGSSNVRNAHQQSPADAATKLALSELYISWASSPAVVQKLEELVAEYLAAAKTMRPGGTNANYNNSMNISNNRHSDPGAGTAAAFGSSSAGNTSDGAGSINSNNLLNGTGRSTSPSPPGSPPATRMPQKGDRPISPSLLGTTMGNNSTSSNSSNSSSTPVASVGRMRVDEMDARASSPGQSSPVSPNTALHRLQQEAPIPLAATHASEPIHQQSDARSDSHHHIPTHHVANAPNNTNNNNMGAVGGNAINISTIMNANNNMMGAGNNNINNNNTNNKMSSGGSSSSSSSVTASPQPPAAYKGRVPVASAADIPIFYRRHEPEGKVEEAPQGELWALRQAFASTTRTPRNSNNNGKDIPIDTTKTIKKDKLHELCSAVFALPEWLSDLLHKRITQYNKLPDTAALSFQHIKKYYDDVMAMNTPNRRLFDLMRSNPRVSYLTHEDLKSAIKLLVDHHTGLDFLKQVEFQEFYCRTVAIRIIYELENQQDRRVSWSHFDRSDLPEVMRQLDMAQDINQILRYFSYEHFYVLYCRFWELDVDRDQHLDIGDLQSYSGGTVTTCVLKRVVAGAGRRLTSQFPDKLDFEDFVYFCLAEEDKNTSPAVYYWFKVLDLDGDGVLSGYELGYFFEEQSRRLIEVGLGEDVRYEDMLCQMLDMVGANKIKEHPQGLTLADLRSCQTPANFFNMIFNATKFARFEHRDPFGEHQLKQQPEKTDWDRFARVEYDRMASEVQQ